MLHLDDRWIWDFWLVDDGAVHHVFYLQAPRALGDPDLRHRHATIGHATSTDLSTWEVLPDALGPGPTGSWDDGAPWTGSIVRHDDRWHMAYTGTCHAEHGRVQRIGLAVSDDLVRWERRDEVPPLTCDPRWYERRPADSPTDEAWRDPWLLADPAGHGVLAFICARTSEGPADERGAVALVRSDDLRTWTVDAPVYAPGLFGQLEVPQVLAHAGRWHLLFCTPADSHSTRWRQTRPAATGTYHVVGSGPTGPFTTMPELVAPRAEMTTYAGKLHVVDGELVYLAALLHDGTGCFRGDLADPVTLTCLPDGHLVPVDRSGGRRVR